MMKNGIHCQIKIRIKDAIGYLVRGSLGTPPNVRTISPYQPKEILKIVYFQITPLAVVIKKKGVITMVRNSLFPGMS